MAAQVLPDINLTKPSQGELGDIGATPCGPRSWLLDTSPCRCRLCRVIYIIGSYWNDTMATWSRCKPRPETGRQLRRGMLSRARCAAHVTQAASSCSACLLAAVAVGLETCCGWPSTVLSQAIRTTGILSKGDLGAHDVFRQHGVGGMDLGAHSARHPAVHQAVRVPGRAAHLARRVMRQQLRARASASGNPKRCLIRFGGVAAQVQGFRICRPSSAG